MYADIDKLLQERERNLLNVQNILDRVSDYHIFAYYLGFNFTINIGFSSPFHKDSCPSFCIFRSRSGSLMYKDFATSDAGDCIRFVEKKLGISFKQALNQININFNLNLISKEEFIPVQEVQGLKDIIIQEVSKDYVDIQIQVREWEIEDLTYWGNYGITKDLLSYYRVFPTAYTKMFGQVWSNHNKLNPCYAYLFNTEGQYSYKLYKPFEKNKKKKWLTNSNGELVIQGIRQLTYTSKILIITKSLKDVMVLRTLGFEAIAVQSESNLLSKDFMNYFESKYERIYLLFDFDLGGVKGTKRFRKTYPKLYIMFLQNIKTRRNGCKDISDTRKLLGFNETKKLLLQTINEAKTSGE